MQITTELVAFYLLVAGAFGAVLRWVASAFDRLRADLAAHKLHVAETYVSKEGLREAKEEIMSGVARIEGAVVGLHQRIDQVLVTPPAAGAPPHRRARIP